MAEESFVNVLEEQSQKLALRRKEGRRGRGRHTVHDKENTHARAAWRLGDWLNVETMIRRRRRSADGM